MRRRTDRRIEVPRQCVTNVWQVEGFVFCPLVPMSLWSKPVCACGGCVDAVSVQPAQHPHKCRPPVAKSCRRPTVSRAGRALTRVPRCATAARQLQGNNCAVAARNGPVTGADCYADYEGDCTSGVRRQPFPLPLRIRTPPCNLLCCVTLKE